MTIARAAAEKIICLNHERDDTYDSRVREATDIITAAITRFLNGGE